MTTYRNIHGRSIQAVTTDPTGEITEGQVWYNTTSDIFKSVLVTEAWSSSSPMGSGRYALGGAGSQTAALGFAGYGAPSPGYSEGQKTEEYNGSGWATGGNLTGTARYYVGGCGTQTAGLTFGGNAPSTGRSALTEEYDGTSWSESGDLSTARRSMGSAGIQTAAAAFGGDINAPGVAPQNKTEEYDGTSWTNGGDLNTPRGGGSNGGPIGTQDATLYAGGFSTPSNTRVANVEEYNGTSWTTVTSLPANRSNSAVAGTQTDGLVFGGNLPPSTNTALKYDGTSWTSAPNLGSAVQANAGAGTASAGLSFGGTPGPSTGTTNTEEFNKSINIITAAAWSSGGAAPDGRAGGSMAGNKDDAMKWGGDTGSSYPGWPTTSHSYNGSSWTADGTIPTGVSAGGQAGAGHTDATTWGGYRPAPNAPTINKTYEYNGSSWTAGGDLNDNREYAYATGAGPQTACIAIGSGPGNSAEHENYNGTAWSEETDFPSGSNFVGTVGSQTATLGVSGSNGTTATWNGSAWTASSNTMSTPRSYGAAGGANSSEAYMFGGGPTDHRTFTELYDGTSWASQPNMSNGRNSAGGSGIQSSGLIAGPFYPGNTAVEEFTAETTTVNVKTLTQS